MSIQLYLNNLECGCESNCEIKFYTYTQNKTANGEHTFNIRLARSVRSIH